MHLKQLDSGNYHFTTDSGKEITLSEYELLGLFQLAVPYQDRLKAKRESGQPYPLPTERVQSARLNLDAHRTEVIVRFVPERGEENAFVMAPDVAEIMRDGLIQKLEQIAEAKRKRTNN
jgi:hypothetical protein